MKIINCAVCGKEIIKKTSTRTCSKDCARKLINIWHVERRKRIKGIKEIPCRYCGSILLPKRGVDVCEREECQRERKMEIHKRYRQSENGKEKRRKLENGIRAKQRALLYNGKPIKRPEYETKEGRLCFRVEKIIDDFFHEREIVHKWQVAFWYDSKKKYIADWVIQIGDKKIIVEYFGLYERDDKIGSEYKQKTADKIVYYTCLRDYLFVPIYTWTLKDELKNITELQLKYKM